MLTAYEIPGNQFSLPATTAIGRHRFVSIDATGKAIQATATSSVIGVSRNEIDPVKHPNAQVLDLSDGIAMVEAAEKIVCGNKVSSDANGKAVVAAGDNYVGIAFSSASADKEIIAVRYLPCVGVGVDGKDGGTIQTITYTSEDLAAGADLSSTVLGAAVDEGNIVGVTIISTGAAAGVDDANTSVFTVKQGSTVKAAQTFNTATAFPGAGEAKVLTVSNKSVSAGDILTLEVTNGATADLPVFMVQIAVELE